MKRILFILAIICLIGIVNADEPTSYIDNDSCLLGTVSSSSCGTQSSTSSGVGGDFTITITPTITETITEIITTITTAIPTTVPTPEPTSYIESGSCLVSETASSGNCGIILRSAETKEVISDVKTLEETTVVEMDIVSKIKTLEVHPVSDIIVSSNAESIMQISDNSSSPSLELYYGYQQSAYQPWQYYYKVESCTDGMCRVVRADFDTKQVWIEMILETELNAIPSMPAYEVLP